MRTSLPPGAFVFTIKKNRDCTKVRSKCKILQSQDVLLLFLFVVVLRINVDLAIFQPYLDLEAGDNQSLKIQVARPGIEPGSSCSASQELNHSATAAPQDVLEKNIMYMNNKD